MAAEPVVGRVRPVHNWHFRAMVILALTLLVAALIAILNTPSQADASARSTGYAALKWAESHETGHPYVWGGTGPGYDCSGAVMEAFAHVGFGLPRTTYEMIASGRIYEVPWRDRRQGDLAFWGDYHVELITQHGTFGAQNSGTVVGWHRLWGAPTAWRIR